MIRLLLKRLKHVQKPGLVDGVTTNPSLLARAGGNPKNIIKQICNIISGPVSVEVMAHTSHDMIQEGLSLAEIAKNVCIKAPLTMEGLKACRALSQKDIAVNVTLCFSASQALLAAKASARFVSPFIGRLDDLGQIGLHTLREIIQIYDNYPTFKTEILAASIRHLQHVIEAAKMGVDVVTLPPKMFNTLSQHPLTATGIETFQKEWNQANLQETLAQR